MAKKSRELRIVEATVLEGYKVQVKLTDGTERTLDIEPYMIGPVFEPLKTPEGFRQVRVEDGTLMWPGDVDLCPDVLLNTEYAQRGARMLAEKIASRFIEAMPTICEFDGMTIHVYVNEHNPPHIHVKCSGEEASIIIATGVVDKGKIPSGKLKKVRSWLEDRRQQVEHAFINAQSGLPPGKVPPP